MIMLASEVVVGPKKLISCCRRQSNMSDTHTQKTTGIRTPPAFASRNELFLLFLTKFSVDIDLLLELVDPVVGFQLRCSLLGP